MFIQLIVFYTRKSNDIDIIKGLAEDWAEKTEGRRTTRRSIVTQDTDDKSKYTIIVFFDSYESAMENSYLPETVKFAADLDYIVGPLIFYNQNVIDDVVHR